MIPVVALSVALAGALVIVALQRRHVVELRSRRTALFAIVGDQQQDLRHANSEVMRLQAMVDAQNEQIRRLSKPVELAILDDIDRALESAAVVRQRQGGA